MKSLKAKAGLKIFGLFAPEALAYELDRDPVREPSLAEMTAKAIEVLSIDRDGFSLMVEGSKIDWAAHANDPVGLVGDILAFDDAVKISLDFARRNGDTVVIAASDHGNSGISMGDRSTTSGYDTLPLSAFVDPLRKARRTGEGLESLLAPDRSNTKEILVFSRRPVC